MKNLFKLIILFVFAILQLNPVFAKNVSFTVISDSHLAADKQQNKMTPSIRNLMKAVEQANADTSDFVVFLGDNLRFADRINLAMFSKIINKLKKPVYTTIGNKDLSKSKGLQKKEYFRILNKFSSNRTKTAPEYKKYNDLILIFLAGTNETVPTERGYYKADELLFLDNTLTKFKDNKVVIFQHFPVVLSDNDPEKLVIKADEYLKILDRHTNVLAVVSGHYNKEEITEKNGVKHISIAALGQSGEYEQIKIFKNKDGSYSLVQRIFDVNE